MFRDVQNWALSNYLLIKCSWISNFLSSISNIFEKLILCLFLGISGDKTFIPYKIFIPYEIYMLIVMQNLCTFSTVHKHLYSFSYSTISCNLDSFGILLYLPKMGIWRCYLNSICTTDQMNKVYKTFYSLLAYKHYNCNILVPPMMNIVLLHRDTELVVTVLVSVLFL